MTSRPSVFDDRVRTDATPATNEESTFAFLNRVSGAFWEHARALIEDWCSHIADDIEFVETRGRIRSGDNGDYNSAILELYIHEALRRSGHDIVIHPILPHTSRRPDFYAEKDGAGFYIEAIVPGVSKQKKAAQSRKNRLMDVVNRLEAPNFYLWLHELKEGASDPKPANLRHALRTWLKEIDPDTIDTTDLSTTPRLRWEDGDWAAEFSALPVGHEARGRQRPGRRAIAVDGHYPVEWVNDAATIVKALEAKDSEYGRLDRPFIVAVGLSIHDTDRWHATNAFYGHERVMFTDGADDAQAFRNGDGYFGAPGRWEHTRVSGVLLVNALQPYHLHATDAALWSHPGAEHPLPPLEWPGVRLDVVDGQLVTSEPSSTTLEFFGLPTPWPPGEAFPRG